MSVTLYPASVKFNDGEGYHSIAAMAPVSASDPLMDGTASPGSSAEFAKANHVHPTDTSRLPVINNAGAHNGIYRGKYLGAEVTQAQYAVIDAGTFEDLYIGDYWTIPVTINGTTTDVNWRIAAFDYWLHTGDTECTTHHIVIVPDTCLYDAQMHNTTSGGWTPGVANNPVTGAYVGSDMYKYSLAMAKTAINNAFGSVHVLNHREFLKNAVTNGYESGFARYDSTVELMTEQMVYGGKIFANAVMGTNWAEQHVIGKSQLPLFALEPSRICNRSNWWLCNVASSTNFSNVGEDGVANANGTSNAFGVRPCFGICA